MEATLTALVVNNIRQHYQKQGQGSPLLFVPGSFSDYRTWISLANRLAPTHTCYVLSRRCQYP